MDTYACQPWVGLRVMLGPIQIQHQRQGCPPAAKNRSPSYYRKQERRKAGEAAVEATNNKRF